jgi:predicted branched-subunit amino acid permease
MAPWLVGVVPFGLVIGIGAARAGMPLAGWATGPLIYAGSAQVAVIGLLDAGAGPLVPVAAALAINGRLVLYSAAMAPRWRSQPVWWRGLAAYLLVDPSLAVGTGGYERATEAGEGHRHYLGGAVLLWAAWLTAIGLGATVGSGLPEGLHLDFVIPLYLAGEVVTRLRTRAALHAAAVAAIVAVAAIGAPLHLGTLVALVAGCAAGLRSEGRSSP